MRMLRANRTAMSVGRIAYTTAGGPRVLPVNYVLRAMA